MIFTHHLFRVLAILILMSGVTAQAAEKIKIVLIAGTTQEVDRVGHHDYLGGCRLLQSLLEQTPGVETVLVKDGWPSDESVFDNTDEWYDSIPEDVRPKKNQPFYHLFAETPDKAPYIAYVSEQNLEEDQDPDPIHHPGIDEYFDVADDGNFTVRGKMN